jgi:hypothetical protein
VTKEPNCKDLPRINLQSKLDGEKCICVNLCVFISVLYSLCAFFFNCICLECIVIILCVFVVSYVYLL